MMKKSTLFFIFLISTSVLYAQNKFDFEKEYDRAYKLFSQNLDSSEVALNKVIANAKEGKELEYAVRAYNLKAMVYYYRSDVQTCQELANQSYELSKSIKYIYGEAISLKTLAFVSANLGMETDARLKIDQAFQLIEGDTTQQGYKIRGYLYSGGYYGVGGDPKELLYCSRKAAENYKKIKDKSMLKERNKLLSVAYKGIAVAYTGQKKFDSARIWFKKGLSINNVKDKLTEVETLYFIGNSYFKQNKRDSAIYYYEKVLSLAKKYKYKQFEVQIFRDIPMEEFLSFKSAENTHQILKRKDSVQKEVDSIKRNSINTFFVNNEKKFKKEIEEKESHYNIVLWVAISTLILLAFFVTYHLHKRKQYKQIIQQIYAENQLRQKKFLNTEETGESIEASPFLMHKQNEQLKATSDEAYYENLNISPEMEEKILKLLDKFEQKQGFNEKGISLYNLANSFNVNTKYLSVIIRKNKGIPFNNYITQLRINYIVDQLLNEPKFSKYRISHLAEISGFSSHSAFSSEFKKQMGRHPSIFIKELKSIK